MHVARERPLGLEARPLVEREIEDPAVGMLLRNHAESGRLSRTRPCVNQYDTTAGGEDTLLFVGGSNRHRVQLTLCIRDAHILQEL